VSVGVSPRRREKISGRSSAASSALAKGRGGGSAGRGRGETGGRGLHMQRHSLCGHLSIAATSGIM
jgi:hypothetical protein